MWEGCSPAARTERADSGTFGLNFWVEYAASIFREEVLFLVIFEYGEGRTEDEIATIGK